LKYKHLSRLSITGLSKKTDKHLNTKKEKKGKTKDKALLKKWHAKNAYNHF